MLQTAKQLLERVRDQEGPIVSIYLTTHRTSPDSIQDPITFKNMILEAKSQLEEKYPRRVWEKIIRNLEELQQDPVFWSHSEDGLAVFAYGDTLEYVRANQTFEEQLIIQDYLYLVPLLMVTPEREGYLVDLAKDRVSIYEVKGSRVKPMEQDQIKTSFKELFDDLASSSDVNFGTFAGGMVSYHGFFSLPEAQEKDREKYFRYLDEQLAKMVPGQSPRVILAGVADNITKFRNVAKAKIYYETAIDKPFASLGHKEQEEAITKVTAPFAQSEMARKIENYGLLKAQDKVIFDKGRILSAAQEGRVAQIIIARKFAQKADQEVNRIVSEALENGASIHTAQEENFQDQLAAVLRY